LSAGISLSGEQAFFPQLSPRTTERWQSPRTINADVGALSTMLRWGVRQKLIGTNPLTEIEPLPHENPKEGRPLSLEEVKRLLDKSPQPWRDMWYALLVTGMRKEELVNLRFRDVDWEGREIIVRPAVAKNAKERRIPIDSGLWDILQRQKESRLKREPGHGKTPAITGLVRARFTRDHVFVTTQNTPLEHRSCVYNAFMRCCKLALIKTKNLDAEDRLIDHVDVHSLRRTFATSLLASGADPKSVNGADGASNAGHDDANLRENERPTQTPGS
jgi:integrase